jgi:ribonuclease Y
MGPFSTLLIGFGLGILLFWIGFRFKKGGFDKLALSIIQEAEKQNSLKKKLFEEELAQKEKLFEQRHEAYSQAKEKKFEKVETRIEEKQALVEEKFHQILKKLSEIEKKEELTNKTRIELQKKLQECDLVKERYLLELESLSTLSTEEAKELFLSHTEEQLRQETHLRSTRILEELGKDLEEKVAHTLATAFNRLALPVASELAIKTVALPSEEMKSRIIGREGRNIRALEHLTGVNILVDETPQAIVISGLDPNRKQIAKTALIDLLQDGRIHPTRIEEAVKKAELMLEKQIKDKGDEALLKTGLYCMHPELIHLLGSLHFRFVQGQNILDHSIEVSHIMGLLAAELALDIDLAKRIGLLHDIGKAVSQHTEGSHAFVGSQIALKYGESDLVVNGIGCHHHEIAPLTTEASLCSTANEISNLRKGARLDSIEQYMKRLRKLEAIAADYPGVEHVSALLAGKEIRVIVTPESVNDREMAHLARTIAKRIESELTYPGKIKVTVIREKKAVEYAI